MATTGVGADQSVTDAGGGDARAWARFVDVPTLLTIEGVLAECAARRLDLSVRWVELMRFGGPVPVQGWRAQLHDNKTFVAEGEVCGTPTEAIASLAKAMGLTKE